MSHRNLNIKTLIRLAMLIALSTVLTLFPQIPAGNGYVHFGDCIIYLAAIFLGPVSGALVGAIGHALADILSGFAIFAIPTFLIKGLVGFAVGKIVSSRSMTPIRLILAALSALVIVGLGYFLTELFLYGISGALLSLFSTPVQWLMSVAASAVLIPVLQRIKGKIGL